MGFKKTVKKEEWLLVLSNMNAVVSKAGVGVGGSNAYTTVHYMQQQIITLDPTQNRR